MILYNNAKTILLRPGYNATKDFFCHYSSPKKSLELVAKIQAKDWGRNLGTLYLDQI